MRRHGNDKHIVRHFCRQRLGEEGYFRIIRGEHKCGISAAVTSDSQWLRTVDVLRLTRLASKLMFVNTNPYPSAVMLC